MRRGLGLGLDLNLVELGIARDPAVELELANKVAIVPEIGELISLTSSQTLFKNSDDKYQTVPANCGAKTGSRVVENLCKHPNDMTVQSGTNRWFQQLPTNVIDFETVDIEIGTQVIYYNGEKDFTNKRVTIRCYLEYVAGDLTDSIAFGIQGNGVDYTRNGVKTYLMSDLVGGITVSTTMQDFTKDFSGGIRLYVLADAGNNGTVRLKIKKAQIQDKTDRADPTIPDNFVDGSAIHNLGVASIKSFPTENGTTVDINGKVTDAAGAPLIDMLGEQYEPEATQLLLYPNELDNAAWAKGADIAVTPNDIAGHDGRKTADKIFAITGSGHKFIRVINGAATSGDKKIFYVIAKKGNHRYLGVRPEVSVSGNDNVVFDFDTETFPFVPASEVDDYGFFSLRDGWYLVWAAATLSVTEARYSSICLTDSLGDGSPELSANDYLYIAHAQMVDGTAPTSPIRASGTPVTRNKRIHKIKYPENCLIDFKIPFKIYLGAIPVGNETDRFGGVGEVNENIQLMISTGRKIKFQLQIASTTYSIFSDNALNLYQVYEGDFIYSSVNGMSMIVEGVTQVDTDPVTTPLSFTSREFNVGNDHSSGRGFIGHCFKLYVKKL